MATSGSYLTSQVVNAYTGDGCPDRANISWSATWDASSMLWTINWSANGAGYYNNNYVTIFSGTVTITDGNGNTIQTKSMSGQIPYARKDVQLVSGSFSVGVNTYGDRNVAFSATFRIGVNGSSGESTGSQTFALDNIPLASTISSVTQNVSVGSSGGVATVNIVRNNASYTHRVVWTFGSNSYTQTGQGTTASYTIPASWLAAIPNSASGSASVTVTTFNGSTQIGQSASATFTITAAVNPSIGGFSVAPRGTAYNAGITTVYIAGYSTALLSASSAAGVNGSSIAKYEFINGSTVIATYNSSASSYSHTTGTLTGSSASFSVRVTDTRGRTATKAASAITINAYATPSFSTASAYRCDSSGTAQNDGTYIRVTASAVATPSENSITALTYSTKATTSNTWSAEANVGSGVTASGFANTTSYDVRITATDKLGQSSYRYFTIPTAEYTMDFKVGGKGVAFGKVAETDNCVDFAWAQKVGNWKHGFAAGSQFLSTSKGYTASGSWEKVPDLSLTAPVTGQYVIEAVAAWQYASPRGVAIQLATNGYPDIAAITDVSNYPFGNPQYLHASCIANLGAGEPIYVWCKYSSGAQSLVFLYMWLL